MPSDLPPRVSSGLLESDLHAGTTPGADAADVDERRRRGPGSARRLLAKVALFVGLNLVGMVLVLAVANWFGQRATRDVGETSSVLRVMPENTDFDVVIMGPSHAFEFAWSGNHAITERNLGVEVLNTGMDGAGPVVEDIYYDLFRARGNTADTIVYFVHPFVLYSDKFNEQNRFTGREPVRGDLFRELLRRGFSLNEIVFYVQSKLNPGWLLDRPVISGSADAADRIDPRQQAAGTAMLYPDGTDPEAFRRYSAALERSVAQMRADGSRVVLIVPPVLLGEPKGLEQAMAFYDGLAQRHGVEVFDFHDLQPDPSYFQRDLSHLNAKGVDWFTREVLKPILDGDGPPPSSR